MKTKLLVGSSADYEVRLDGKAVGTGKGTGKEVRPDQDALRRDAAGGQAHADGRGEGRRRAGASYARFLDPDRKLRYPDAEK